MKLPKEMTLAEIAAIAGGQVAGPAATTVSAVALDPFSANQGELAIVFDPKLIRRLSECTATAVVVPKGTKTDLPRVEVERPLLALARMLKAVAPRRFYPERGIHATAVVDPTCQIDPDAAIGPYVVIGPHTTIGKGTIVSAGCIIGGKVTIGEDCILYPSCLISDYVRIGNRVILQQGTSIGADGFGYVAEKTSNLERRLAGSLERFDEPNPLVKIPQIGTAIIEDDVEIGSYTTVDRATMGATIVGKGSKLDNQVMIAHNVKLGSEVIIVSQTGIAGSSTVGDRVALSGHVAIKDHVHIAKDAMVEGCAAVMRDVGEGEVVCGIPAINARDYFVILALTRKLPQMREELAALKRKVTELESALSQRKPALQGDHACD